MRPLRHRHDGRGLGDPGQDWGALGGGERHGELSPKGFGGASRRGEAGRGGNAAPRGRVLPGAAAGGREGFKGGPRVPGGGPSRTRPPPAGAEGRTYLCSGRCLGSGRPHRDPTGGSPWGWEGTDGHGTPPPNTAPHPPGGSRPPPAAPALAQVAGSGGGGGLSPAGGPPLRLPIGPGAPEGGAGPGAGRGGRAHLGPPPPSHAPHPRGRPAGTSGAVRAPRSPSGQPEAVTAGPPRGPRTERGLLNKRRRPPRSIPRCAPWGGRRCPPIPAASGRAAPSRRRRRRRRRAGPGEG
ncbi:collagen alpha-1(III) chain-like [Poecile atricapillus]|uniref:collagen alpha-1(III) chain-like n=1 Tax=Poecile atricapillus TaxID=48891 RepID=UPI002738820D|nr:collagen alpha-1(III) chain-like [Poecile atricapillus]